MGAIAQQVATSLEPRDILLLRGDLGVGKSTFARALIKSLCGESTEVPSPTFTLVQTYEAPTFTLWHFDLYRLEAWEDLYELGLEEAFETGVSLIEWPERLGNLSPLRWLEILFEYGIGENERLLLLQPREK